MPQRETLLYECDTTFDHYQVVDMMYEGRPARILFSGDRTAAFSGMPLDDDHDMLFDYIQRMFELVSTVRPKRLLMIGGGTYTLPMTLVQSLPDIIVDVLEIDAKLDDIAEAFFGLTAHDRLNIHHTDGKTFLEQTTHQYDIIIIDAFTGLRIPRSLADERTVSLIHKKLSAKGLMAMNIISGYKGVNASPIEHFYMQNNLLKLLYTQLTLRFHYGHLKIYYWSRKDRPRIDHSGYALAP